MNYYQTTTRLRERKSRRLMRKAGDELYTVREVCEIVNSAIPSGIDPDKKLPMICCFENVFLRDCLFVHYERDDDKIARGGMRRGAYALLCNHQVDDYPCIIVDDVLTALNQLLRPIAERVHVPTTVITGSVGKTTTKNFVNCVYSAHARTFCNVTNGNTFENIGFELQRFDKKARFFVQEVNESDPGNTRNASEVLRPEIAIITNMDKSHIGELGSEENIMKAICEITAGMDENGVVIINADNPNSRKASFRNKVVSVGIQNAADCTADHIESFPDRIEFDVTYEGEKSHLTVPVTGTHNIYDAMMAFVAGRISGIPVKTIRRGLKRYRPLGFRQNIYHTARFTIYADCYNASAKSIHAALEVLRMQPRRNGARKVAVLGDIGEIDGFKDEIYRDVAKSVSESDADVLITYGTDMAMVHEHLSRPLETWHETTLDGLCSRIDSVKKNGGVFLFKASRSMHLERAIKKTFPYAYYKGMLPVYAAYGKWTLKTL